MHQWRSSTRTRTYKVKLNKKTERNKQTKKQNKTKKYTYKVKLNKKRKETNKQKNKTKQKNTTSPNVHIYKRAVSKQQSVDFSLLTQGCHPFCHFANLVQYIAII